MGRQLERVLGLRQLILIVVGTVIGSGIFIVPATVLKQTGGLGPALLVWLIAGILSLLGALTYGELGAMHPEAGGLYAYIRDAFGPLPAFLYGWTLFFVICAGSVATLAVAVSSYMGELVPLSPGLGKAVAVTMIAAVAVINVKGTGESAAVQGWTTLLKAGMIVLMSVVLISVGGGGTQPEPTALEPLAPLSLLSAVGVAMIGALWAYEGWQYVTFSAGETMDPQRTFPRGIIAGTAAIAVIYLVANLGYVAALGLGAAAESERVAADAVTAVLGPAAGKVVAFTIVISMFSAANGLMLTAPRAFYAMAQDGIFFRKLAEVHPRFGTPAFAIIATSLWAMILALSGTFERLLTYVVFAGWIFYALGALSIFAYRRTRPEAERPFRVPGYPITPLLFVLAAAAIVVNTLVNRPESAVVGLGVVLLGTPAYFLWRRRTVAPSRQEGEVVGAGAAGGARRD